MAAKECPLCGEGMRLTERDAVDRVPAIWEVKTRRVREWTCPECDYFEEVDDEVKET